MSHLVADPGGPSETQSPPLEKVLAALPLFISLSHLATDPQGPLLHAPLSDSSKFCRLKLSQSFGDWSSGRGDTVTSLGKRLNLRCERNNSIEVSKMWVRSGVPCFAVLSPCGLLFEDTYSWYIVGNISIRTITTCISFKTFMSGWICQLELVVLGPSVYLKYVS